MSAIELIEAERPEDDEVVLSHDRFEACATCAAKPGSPTLCYSCFHNRTLIDRARCRQEDEPAEHDPNVELTFDTVSIYFHGVLHTRFTRSEYQGMTSWTSGPGNFFIEYTMKGGAHMKTEYNDQAKWVAILKQLAEIL